MMLCLLRILGLTCSHLYSGMDTPVGDLVMNDPSVMQQPATGRRV